ncbi:hypothetical protein CTAYLR_000152 [Chrysophaeum taylorii]|uniref:Cytochrome b5 heme-binding domain-containing protein n=1 Tax=Chrysophaeum taylorii TaxID=2483200 RepID=A0AAD7UI33_9STRA|nr:hypothetical protein CTAYLR_000152 [Chrysophaeum taylorii]
MSARRREKGVKPGFSLMDWIRLTEHAKDLAGLKGGRPRAVTMEDVAQHKTEFDAWTILNGRVYNLTPYLHYHPGGIPLLRGVAGKDCTDLFNKHHRWVNGATMLQKCEVGWLATAPPPPLDEDDADAADADAADDDADDADDDDDDDEERKNGLI